MPVSPQAIEQYGPVPYFHHGHMPQPTAEYVCWLDLMGMQNAMLASLPKTANFAMKLLIAASPPQTPPPATVSVCPVIDGLFIHSANKQDLLATVKRTIARLAMACVDHEDDPGHTFLVRGAIAYGPVVDGVNVPTNCFHPAGYLGNQPQKPPLADHIIFGFGVSAAYRASHKAPPFGVVIDDSATEITLGDGGIHGDGPLWHWWKHAPADCDAELAASLKGCVNAYFDWCKDRPLKSGYDIKRLLEHRALFAEYYIEFEDPV